MRNRSSASGNLLAAWSANTKGRSAGSIPWPSSTTRTSSAPTCSRSTSIRVAPALAEFSSNSSTTDAGRSITSPAPILDDGRG